MFVRIFLQLSVKFIDTAFPILKHTLKFSLRQNGVSQMDPVDIPVITTLEQTFTSETLFNDYKQRMSESVSHCRLYLIPYSW